MATNDHTTRKKRIMTPATGTPRSRLAYHTTTPRTRARPRICSPMTEKGSVGSFCRCMDRRCIICPAAKTATATANKTQPHNAGKKALAMPNTISS